MNSPIIEARNVSKRYQIGAAGVGQFHTLRDRIASLFEKRKSDAATQDFGKHKTS